MDFFFLLLKWLFRDKLQIRKPIKQLFLPQERWWLWESQTSLQLRSYLGPAPLLSRSPPELQMQQQLLVAFNLFSWVNTQTQR